VSPSPPARPPQRRNLRRDGAAAEDLAARYLAGEGYRIIERNFRFRRMGEIDIIARDGMDIVFCEVKMRTSGAYGLPEYAVTPAKQATIRRVASAYLALKGIDGQACRFDVVTIRGGGLRPVVTLFKNAF
jgi:putative endonuclease